MSEPLGKLTVKGLGHLDICDAESLIIAEYFLDFINKQIERACEHTEINPRDIVVDFQPSSVMRLSEGLTETEAKQEKPRPKSKKRENDTSVSLSVRSRPKRGRKQGGFMKCIDVIRKYYENKNSFMIQSFLNRQPRFTEDEVKDAIAELIQNKEVYQISSEEIGIIRRDYPITLTKEGREGE